MPVKRKRLAPRRINQDTPQWAVELLQGKRPERDTPEWGQAVEWAYLGAEIVGLPLGHSDAGMRLWNRSRR